MKLRQGQIWKVNQEYVRIVAVERLAVDYMTMKGPDTKGGVHARATKKQFCTHIKTGTLIFPVESPANTPQQESQ